MYFDICLVRLSICAFLNVCICVVMYLCRRIPQRCGHPLGWPLASWWPRRGLREAGPWPSRGGGAVHPWLPRSCLAAHARRPCKHGSRRRIPHAVGCSEVLELTNTGQLGTTVLKTPRPTMNGQILLQTQGQTFNC